MGWLNYLLGIEEPTPETERRYTVEPGVTSQMDMDVSKGPHGSIVLRISTTPTDELVMYLPRKSAVALLDELADALVLGIETVKP